MRQNSLRYNMDSNTDPIIDIFSASRLPKTKNVQYLYLSAALWSLQTNFRYSLKRILDVAVAAILLVLASPVMLITAIAIRLESPGAVIFQQTRVGKWGEHFTCYKFRSMAIDAEDRKRELMQMNEADGPVFKMQNDPRITRVGKLIRKFSIDELPQLYNVLKGDMSMVGPRPSLPQEVEAYQLHQLRRMDALPGLTGLQQVSGRSNIDFERWIKLDLQYVAEQSLRRDIEIMFKTIPSVLLGKGAY